MMKAKAPKAKRKTTKAIVMLGVTALGLVGIVGALHAPFARSLLMKMGGCPLGKASAAEVEQGRMQAVRNTRGATQAPARPALGFTLDASTPEDVHVWAKANLVTCNDKREGMLITCKDVAASVLMDRKGEPGVVDEVSFAFRPRDRKLVNVTVVSFALPAEEGARRMQAATERLAKQEHLGAPTHAAGEATAQRLSQGGFMTATAEYTYADYMAEVTATSFTRGVTVREHFLSATE